MDWCAAAMQQQQQQDFPILPACSLLFQKSSILPHKMDISKTFKATLKAVRMRKNNLSEDITGKPLVELGKKQHDSVFKLRSKEIVSFEVTCSIHLLETLICAVSFEFFSAVSTNMGKVKVQKAR